MRKYRIKIRFNVSSKGGFLNPAEAYKFVAAFTLKNAEANFKPDDYRLSWYRKSKMLDKEYGIKRTDQTPLCHSDDYNCVTFIYIKEFEDRVDATLWIMETEESLNKFFKENKDNIQNVDIARRNHSLFVKVTRRFLFWEYETEVEI